MHKDKQRAAGKKDDAPGEPGAADLRSEQLAEDTDAVLDEIDCCLAAAEAEQEAARRRERFRAVAEYDAIAEECLENCIGAGSEVCPHDVRLRVWMASYAHLFMFCCGVPVFGAEDRAGSA